VLLDYKDEYRGLVEGPAQHYIAGERERQAFETDHYQQLLAPDAVVIARHPRLDAEGWREIAAAVIREARTLGDVLIVVDEAHFVAPQRGGFPDTIKGLATTGRGEGASAMWVTQRLTELEETVLAQTTARFLGGFESDADLAKIGPITEYPTDVHRSGGHHVGDLPESLNADKGPVSLRKFESHDGSITGSEWIYSDDSGTMERRNSTDLNPQYPHVGARGKPIRTEWT